MGAHVCDGDSVRERETERERERERERDRKRERERDRTAFDDEPPPQKNAEGYLSDACATPHESTEIGSNTPMLKRYGTMWEACRLGPLPVPV